MPIHYSVDTGERARDEPVPRVGEDVAGADGLSTVLM